MRGHMHTITKVFSGLLTVGVLLYGCNGGSSSDSDSSSTYEDMIASYTLFSVEGLWQALDDDTDDNGTYILLKGVLHAISDNEVTLIDRDTDKTITCTFLTSMDISALETVLANTGSDGSDVVTIGGICYFNTDGTSYPYLDQCDYYYVNTDG